MDLTEMRSNYKMDHRKGSSTNHNLGSSGFSDSLAFISSTAAVFFPNRLFFTSYTKPTPIATRKREIDREIRIMVIYDIIPVAVY